MSELLLNIFKKYDIPEPSKKYIEHKKKKIIVLDEKGLPWNSLDKETKKLKIKEYLEYNEKRIDIEKYKFSNIKFSRFTQRVVSLQFSLKNTHV